MVKTRVLAGLALKLMASISSVTVPISENPRPPETAREGSLLPTAMSLTDGSGSATVVVVVVAAVVAGSEVIPVVVSTAVVAILISVVVVSVWMVSTEAVELASRVVIILVAVCVSDDWRLVSMVEMTDEEAIDEGRQGPALARPVASRTMVPLRR